VTDGGPGFSTHYTIQEVTKRRISVMALTTVRYGYGRTFHILPIKLSYLLRTLSLSTNSSRNSFETKHLLHPTEIILASSELEFTSSESGDIRGPLSSYQTHTRGRTFLNLVSLNSANDWIFAASTGVGGSRHLATIEELFVAFAGGRRPFRFLPLRSG